MKRTAINQQRYRLRLKKDKQLTQIAEYLLDKALENTRAERVRSKSRLSIPRTEIEHMQHRYKKGESVASIARSMNRAITTVRRACQHQQEEEL